MATTRRDRTTVFRGTTSAPADGQAANDRRWTGARERARRSAREMHEKRERAIVWKGKEGKRERRKDRERERPRKSCTVRASTRENMAKRRTCGDLCARVSAAGGWWDRQWLHLNFRRDLIEANSIGRFVFFFFFDSAADVLIICGYCAGKTILFVCQ